MGPLDVDKSAKDGDRQLAPPREPLIQRDPFDEAADKDESSSWASVEKLVLPCLLFY